MTTREVFKSVAIAAVITVPVLILFFIATARDNAACRERGGEPTRIGCLDPKVFR